MLQRRRSHAHPPTADSVCSRHEAIQQRFLQPRDLRFQFALPDTRLPVAGAQVFAGDDADLAAPLGVVTSSSPAPLASQQAVALAMLRWKVADPDGEVIVVIDGEQVRARVKAISNE